MPEDKVEFVLRNGLIVDGSGSPGCRGDVAVGGGEIIGLDVDSNFPAAARRIDVEGAVITPGFIDIHAHSDLSLLEDGRGLSKAFQGVTTEVNGNCSMSPAPVTAENKKRVRDTFTYMAGAVDWNWNSFEEYLKVVGDSKIALNIVPQVGHGALRAAVVGFEPRVANEREIEEMKNLLDRALSAGAAGMSTGLVYSPCCYADRNELVQLAAVVAEHDALFSIHMRNEGYRLLEAVEETLDIVRNTGVRTEISHLKAAGEKNWGLVRPVVEKIDAAAEEGFEIGFDVYPYLVGSTYLSALLPRWARRGSREELVERLKDVPTRRRLRRAILEGDADWPGYNGPGSLTPEGTTISSVGSEKNRDLVGKTLAEIAGDRDCDPWDCFFDLLVEERGNVIGLYEYMCEEDVRFLYSHPCAAVGSDGLAISPAGHWLESKPHPRYYGTFPRMLRRYAIEDDLLSLEEAVRRMTSLPARRLGLKNRGLLQKGYAADIVVFNPETLEDTATYQNPHRLARGIEHLFVNGTPVISDSHQPTESYPGKVLTSGRS
ncbi:MAG: N-acyl-D-amino-acid deacylase family protein [bacterium]